MYDCIKKVALFLFFATVNATNLFGRSSEDRVRRPENLSVARIQAVSDVRIYITNKEIFV